MWIHVSISFISFLKKHGQCRHRIGINKHSMKMVRLAMNKWHLITVLTSQQQKTGIWWYRLVSASLSRIYSCLHPWLAWKGAVHCWHDTARRKNSEKMIDTYWYFNHVKSPKKKTAHEWSFGKIFQPTISRSPYIPTPAPNVWSACVTFTWYRASMGFGRAAPRREVPRPSSPQAKGRRAEGGL